MILIFPLRLGVFKDSRQAGRLKLFELNICIENSMGILMTWKVKQCITLNGSSG